LFNVVTGFEGQNVSILVVGGVTFTGILGVMPYQTQAVTVTNTDTSKVSYVHVDDIVTITV